MSNKNGKSAQKPKSNDELLVDNLSFVKAFLEGEEKEGTQEEEIEKFKLKKEEEYEELSEEEKKAKRKKEEEEEEELKKVKAELLASLQRVKAIVKRIYGNNTKLKLDLKEDTKSVKRVKIKEEEQEQDKQEEGKARDNEKER